jgi:CRISPR system Cascade subunit CasE
MIYLSLLTPNLRSREAQRDLKAPYEMHRTLLRAFPSAKFGIDRTDAEAAGVLFRVEDRSDGFPTVLVQSRVAPDWSVLNPGYLSSPPQAKPVELALRSGQVLAFRLHANPTRRLSAGKGHKGKRVGIYKLEEQLLWLARKGEQHGFQLLQAQVATSSKLKDEQAIRRGSQRHDLELLAVRFDGLLSVGNPNRLIEAVEAGIGSAKGFGFGLLSLAPAR